MEINTKGQELRLPKEYLTETNDAIHKKQTGTMILMTNKRKEKPKERIYIHIFEYKIKILTCNICIYIKQPHHEPPNYYFI